MVLNYKLITWTTFHLEGKMWQCPWAGSPLRSGVFQSDRSAACLSASVLALAAPVATCERRTLGRTRGQDDDRRRDRGRGPDGGRHRGDPRGRAVRLLQDGEVDPRYVVLAAARVTGELGADISRIGDVDLETVLGDLADLVREAGRAHAEDPPVVGSA